jgi:hypothetical protein
MTETYPTLTWTGNFQPITIAKVYDRAARLIAEHGYNGRIGSHAGNQPYSLVTAIEESVRIGYGSGPGAATTEIADLTEEALTRLEGVLYLTGQVTSPSTSLATVVDKWDDEHPGHTPEQAMVVLHMAQVLVEAIATQDHI